mgnify:CR=1 FL=1
MAISSVNLWYKVNATPGPKQIIAQLEDKQAAQSLKYSI